MSKINWSTQKKQLSELKEYEDNPRDITEEGLNHLKDSIEKFGCAEPLVVNVDGIIVGGHGRLKALESLGITEIDCYVPDRGLNEEEFQELNIRLNKNIAGVWNFDILANRFNQNKLMDWGFKKVEFEGGYKTDDKNKEVDVDSLDEKTQIVLKFTSDDYLEVIELFNKHKEVGESYEAFVMRVLLGLE